VYICNCYKWDVSDEPCILIRKVIIPAYAQSTLSVLSIPTTTLQHVMNIASMPWSARGRPMRLVDVEPHNSRTSSRVTSRARDPSYTLTLALAHFVPTHKLINPPLQCQAVSCAHSSTEGE
jgi:hypothetical protein